MKRLLFSVFIVISLFQIKTLSQTEQQVYKKLQEQGITTKKDVAEELKKRNMTEDDARKLAKQYGMDYDAFINSYILGGKDLNIPQANTGAPTTDVKTTPTAIVTDTNPVQETVVKEENKSETKVEVQAKSTSENLQYFGYDVFQNNAKAFAPNESGPIDPGYLIGPGDVLRLYIWGSVELQYELTVDKEGRIFIPVAGQVFVSGIEYKNLQQKLTSYLSKFYDGLSQEPPTAFLDVTLAKLKPIRIYVLGEVAKPGAYNMSSFATVFNALYSFGGPLNSGSLRDIRVIRNQKIISKIDLYDYLLKGQLIGDTRLQDNDMIFVPPRGKTVSVKGEIRRPAIYELTSEENLQKLLTYSGGLLSTAYLGRSQINRIIPFSERANSKLEREVVDISLNHIVKDSADYNLYDGDILTIFPILDKVENFVTINGSVYRPGNYELSKAPTLKKLIENAYGLLPETYYGKADIIRTRPDETNEFITVDLQLALKDDKVNNVKLEPRDQVKIYSIYDLVDKKTVSISGYVKQPYSIPFADSLTLYDLVFRAGGLQDPFFRGKAYLLRADLIRVNPDGVTTRIIPFDLQELLKEKSVKLDLMPGDKVFIYKADVDKVVDKFVTIEGEVKKPGQYPLNTNMTIPDLILQAGGYTEQSLRTEAYVSRLRPSGYSGEKLTEVLTIPLPIDFRKISRNTTDSSKTNFYLEHRDIVIVRKNPNYEPQRTISLKGEVKYPGTYVLENKNETLLELLKKAGGPTAEAFLFGTYFNRGGKRVIADFQKLYEDEDENQDILLHQGDDIFIPKRPNSVLVGGEVNTTGLFKYFDGSEVKDYISLAGGEKDSANYILYTQANGSTKKVGFGFFSSNPTVTDGSIISVTKLPPPAPSEKVDWGTTIRDVFAIVTSAVTIIVLARQIK